MADTIDDITEALNAHLHTRDDSRIITGWVATVMYQGMDDEGGGAVYDIFHGAGQSYALTEGLINVARKLHDDHWADDGTDE